MAKATYGYSSKRGFAKRTSTTKYRRRAPAVLRLGNRNRVYRDKVVRPRFTMYNRLLAQKLTTKLTYCDTKTITPGSTMANHVFRLNSIFDPDFTGVGHQPGFHDQWANLYNQYRVTSAEWTLTFDSSRGFVNHETILTSGTNILQAVRNVDSSHEDSFRNPAIIFYETSDDLDFHFTEAADLNFLRETSKSNKRVKYRMTSGDPFKKYVLKGSTSMRSILSDVTAFNTPSDFGASPTDVVHMAVGVMSKDGGVASTYRVDLKIVYTVELSDPKDVNQS